MRVHTRFPAPVLERVVAELEAAATAREAQLAALPPARTPVATAHEASVRRILAAIRAAQAQLADGSYGGCERCGRPADPHLVTARPWAPRCGACG